MICGTVTCSIGVGSALSASTSTSNPGYAGASTLMNSVASVPGVTPPGGMPRPE